VTFAGGTSVIIEPEGSRTILPDGAELVARPQDDAEYAARAASLGYGEPVEMTREHDFCHALMAECLGLPHSPALWAAAHPLEERDAAAIGAEEDEALSFQAWLNGKAEAPWLFLAKWKAAILCRTRSGGSAL
jgi:hypothetical protein